MTTCTRCKGSGNISVTCQRCGGTGRIIPPWGRGLPREHAEMNCPTCVGRGTLDRTESCPICKGTGEV